MESKSVHRVTGNQFPTGIEYAESRASVAHLALHVTGKSLQCAMYDLDRDELVWLNQFPLVDGDPEHATLQQILKGERLFDSVFRKCSISSTPGEFSLIPSGFFDASLQGSFLDPSVAPSDILHHRIKKVAAMVVYTFPGAIEKMASRRFPTLRTVSFAGLLAEYGATHSTGGTHFYAHVADHCMVLVVARESELLLCNRYEVRRADDALYHIGNAAIQLGVDLGSAHLHHGGEPDQFPELQGMLATYCGHIHSLRDALNVHKTIEFPGSRESWFPVISHFLCEL